jgi:gluconolactonase
MHHPDCRAVFPGQPMVEWLAGGFCFIEGPVWAQALNSLLFSDIPANCLYRFQPPDQVTVFRQPSHHANGLVIDHQGRLIACEHGLRRITRLEHDQTVAVLVDQFDGKPLNSPNDVAVAADGTLYFTDPPYGIRPEQQEQPYQGVYRLDPAGNTTLLLTDFDRPNGLAFSPDQRLLYLADSSERRHIRRFSVAADGSLTGGEVFCRMPTGIPGPPDGMTVDATGNLFCTGPGGVWIVSPDGRHLGTVVIPEVAANCTWGDDDRQSLYITATTSLYRLRCR